MTAAMHPPRRIALDSSSAGKRVSTPPVVFSPSSARRMRSDSPAPIILHSSAPRNQRAGQEQTGSDEGEGEEGDFPPSISQRRVHRSRLRNGTTGHARKVIEGDARMLGLPLEKSTNSLKEKRSFERTRRWAEDAERSRCASRAEGECESARELRDELEEVLDGLISDRSIDGSSASPIPPRTPSPSIISSDPPQLSLISLPETPKPTLSIDEIVRLHAASATSALTAAKEKARKELGLTSSDSPAAVGNNASGSNIGPRTRRIKPNSRPPISARTSSSPTARVHVIPSRSSSMSSAHQGQKVSSGDDGSSSSRSPTKSSSARHGSDPYTTASPMSGRSIRFDLNPGPSTPLDRSKSARSASASPATTQLRPAVSRASTAPLDQTHEMALHLRSAELNKSLVFPRPYPDRPLCVSYADVGKSDGLPVFVFLGVGCVRYLIALYDQLAQVYGLRLICVDRWGYGKTDQVDEVDRGLIEWSGVIGQVARALDISRFQVIAHSAGTPYAMAVARRYPRMIRGRLHLLAPWVGQDHDAVSKWLKWVPGGVIKTATAADHRLQTYFLGKAPKLQYAPIGFDARAVVTPPPVAPAAEPDQASEGPTQQHLIPATPSSGLIRRASTVFSSGTSSGSSNIAKPRSKSIYGTAASASNISLSLSTTDRPPINRAASLSPSAHTSIQGQARNRGSSLSPLAIGRSPGLKGLKQLADLVADTVLLPIPMQPPRTPSSDSRGTHSSAASSRMPITPDQSASGRSESRLAISASELDFGLGEGFDSFGTDLGLALPLIKAGSQGSLVIPPGSLSTGSPASTSVPALGLSVLSLPTKDTDIKGAGLPLPSPAAPAPPDRSASLPPSRFPTSPAFSTALSQASHAECEPGTTSDILRIILNKPFRPWGFEYADVEARAHIWIGTEDKLISERSVSWMQDKCGSTVERREGEGHNLMSSPGVLCDLFRCLAEEARDARRAERAEEGRDGEKERGGVGNRSGIKATSAVMSR